MEKVRFFYHYTTNKDVDLRDYYFYIFFPERDNNKNLMVMQKFGKEALWVRYQKESVDNFVKDGFWIEISAEEAALMV